MFSCITETFFVWLYVFGYNHHFVFQLLAVSTIFCRKFFQVYPPNIRQISVNIHHILPQICSLFCHKFAHYFATNLLIILPQICSLFCHKFAHYNDQIYPNLCITMTRFPQSTENTYICGIQFQISPNLCNFRNNYIPLLEFTYMIIGNFSIV